MLKKILLPLILSLSWIACTPEIVPIDYGADNCDNCMMTISDQRYGAELLTQKGKAYKFDAIECLAAFHIDPANTELEVHSIWITDFSSPGTLIDAKQATFLKSTTLKSPMGLYLSGHTTRDKAQGIQADHPGDLLVWSEVKSYVRESWIDKKQHHGK